tara:strand:+ start:2572 stop:5499 length:2928 start_codon:yes stop_codon:yes gene_type:complete
MSQTEIIYIDCNRQNSVKSDDTTNEWIYPMSDEALVLPVGTQISIQDTFINKKGIGNQSIEIEEDIDEYVNMCYYMSYDPQWTPVREAESDPSVADYEGLYRETFMNLRNTDGAYRMRTGQSYMTGGRVGGRGYVGHFLQETERAGQTSILDDARNVGYPSTPLMCVKSEGNGNIATEEDYTTSMIKPEVRRVNIYVPKGVYGLSELAKLIQDQMTGQSTAVKSGNYQKDYMQNNLNAALTNNANESTYIQKQPIYHIGPFNPNYNALQPYYHVAANRSITGTPIVNANLWCIGTFLGVYVGATPGVGGDAITDYLPLEAELTTDGTDAGSFFIGVTNVNGNPNTFFRGANSAGILRINSEIFQYITGDSGDAAIKRVTDTNNGTAGLTYRIRIKRRGMGQGTDPDNYSGMGGQYERNFASGPVYHPKYVGNENEKVLLRATNTKYNGFYNYDLADAPEPLNWRPPKEDIGMFTTPEGFNDLMDMWKLPTTTPGYAQIRDRFLLAVQLGEEESVYNVPTSEFNKNGPVQPTTGADYFDRSPIGLFGIRDYSKITTQADDWNYNPVRRGYFVGTPDFTLNWSSETSSFQMNNLHNSMRVSSHDQYGNAIEAEGEKCIIYKRLADTHTYGTASNRLVQPGDPDTQNLNFIDPTLSRSLENPSERYGGIAVHNWAETAAKKYSDLDWDNPAVFNQDAIQGHYLRFEDYFSSNQKARIAWKKTIWAKLGFTFDQLASKNGYERMRRYDTDKQTQEAIGLNNAVYGTTTKGNFGVDIFPEIATTYNPNEKSYGENGSQPIRSYNAVDINTSWLPYTKSGTIPKAAQTLGETGNLTGTVDTSKEYFSSFYKNATSTIVLDNGRSINALDLPTLNTYGYYVITSDIIDTHEDSIKNSQNLPMIGLIPLASFTAADFITSANQMIHIIGQPKILNSIKIRILNPDLTPAELDPNSSVIMKIVRPVAPQLQPQFTDGAKLPNKK